MDAGETGRASSVGLGVTTAMQAIAVVVADCCPWVGSSGPVRGSGVWWVWAISPTETPAGGGAAGPWGPAPCMAMTAMDETRTMRIGAMDRRFDRDRSDIGPQSGAGSMEPVRTSHVPRH